MKKLFRKRPEPPDPVIDVTSEEIRLLVEGQVTRSVAWADIREIVTYKYDLWSYDEICISLQHGPEDTDYLELSENWDGWNPFMAVMENRFPSIPESWRLRVMHPAFETNDAVLYSHPDPENKTIQKP